MRVTQREVSCSLWVPHILSQALKLVAVVLLSRWPCGGPRPCYGCLETWGGYVPEIRLLTSWIVDDEHCNCKCWQNRPHTGWGRRQQLSKMRNLGVDSGRPPRQTTRLESEVLSFYSITFAVCTWWAWGKPGLVQMLYFSLGDIESTLHYPHRLDHFSLLCVCLLGINRVSGWLLPPLLWVQAHCNKNPSKHGGGMWVVSLLSPKTSIKEKFLILCYLYYLSALCIRLGYLYITCQICISC